MPIDRQARMPALLSIFRSQRLHMSVADHEMLRTIILAVIAQSDVEARQKMFDEFANKLEKDNLRQRLADWNDRLVGLVLYGHMA